MTIIINICHFHVCLHRVCNTLYLGELNDILTNEIKTRTELTPFKIMLI